MASNHLMPVVYFPHGGGPLPLLGDPAHASLTAYLTGLSNLPRPEVILIISAHWEASTAQLTAAAAPKLLFDYSGFPQESYQYTYPAPGAPERVEAWLQRLAQQGIAAAANHLRGWDHGCFVPLLLSHPKADIPLVQLSLIKGLNPQAHINLGRALAPLREEGVLILGSGLSFHNMQAFFHPTAAAKHHSEAFDGWLQHCLCSDNLALTERTEQLINWQQAPSARFCHPREEHLLPLFVCFGAALGAQATCSFEDYLMGVKVSAFTWG